MTWETIPVRRETKEFLERVKEAYGIKSYDELLKRAFSVSKSETLDLSKTVPPKTGYVWYENYREVPFDGTINQIILSFPKGCKGLVEVRVGVAGSQGLNWICPREGFIALEATTQPFNVTYPVKKGDRVVAEIYNYDDTYEHTIGVTVVLTSKPMIII